MISNVERGNHCLSCLVFSCLDSLWILYWHVWLRKGSHLRNHKQTKNWLDPSRTINISKSPEAKQHAALHLSSTKDFVAVASVFARVNLLSAWNPSIVLGSGDERFTWSLRILFPSRNVCQTPQSETWWWVGVNKGDILQYIQYIWYNHDASFLKSRWYEHLPWSLDLNFFWIAHCLCCSSQIFH